MGSPGVSSHSCPGAPTSQREQPKCDVNGQDTRGNRTALHRTDLQCCPQRPQALQPQPGRGFLTTSDPHRAPRCVPCLRTKCRRGTWGFSPGTVTRRGQGPALRAPAAAAPPRCVAPRPRGPVPRVPPRHADPQSQPGYLANWFPICLRSPLPPARPFLQAGTPRGPRRVPERWGGAGRGWQSSTPPRSSSVVAGGPGDPPPVPARPGLPWGCPPRQPLTPKRGRGRRGRWVEVSRTPPHRFLSASTPGRVCMGGLRDEHLWGRLIRVLNAALRASRPHSAPASAGHPQGRLWVGASAGTERGRSRTAVGAGEQEAQPSRRPKATPTPNQHLILCPRYLTSPTRDPGT